MKTANKIKKFIHKDLVKDGYSAKEASDSIRAAQIKLIVKYDNGATDVFDLEGDKMIFNKDEGCDAK